MSGLDKHSEAAQPSHNQVVNLLGAYERYKEYKLRQYFEASQINMQMEADYNERMKDNLYMRTVYNPPKVHTAPECFTDFMAWLRRDSEVNGLVPPDSNTSNDSAKKPKSASTLKERGNKMSKHIYSLEGYCYNCGQPYVNTTTFCPKGQL
jgi:hypothetical protein